VAHELDPVTGKRTGYDIEILQTESQFVEEGAKVIPRQSIGMQGGVGVNGVDKNGNGIPGASHVHLQVYRGSDPTPLNPLRHLYEYHHPGQPLPQLPEFFPESVPPRPNRPARPDPLLGDDRAPPNAPPGGRRPAAPITRPSTSPPDRLTPPRPPSSVGQPLDITPPVQRNQPAPDGGFEPGSTGATGQLYFSPQSSPSSSVHSCCRVLTIPERMSCDPKWQPREFVDSDNFNTRSDRQRRRTQRGPAAHQWQWDRRQRHRRCVDRGPAIHERAAGAVETRCRTQR
jgi:hypothetical protein